MTQQNRETPPGKCLAPNPLCPPGVYIADPEVRLMPDGLICLYGSRDESPDYWCSTRYDVMWTRDMAVWHLQPGAFATTGSSAQTDYTDAILYAPDCIHHRGTCYLYYCLAGGGDDEGVATAATPLGPFLRGRKIAGVRGIDPAVLVDDDGQAYLYWGQIRARCARLTEDMTAIDPASVREDVLVHGDTPYAEDAGAWAGSGEHWFNEGASIRKRAGVYYLVYAQGGRHGRGCCACLAYATSASPLGPFTYRGVIIDNFGSGPNLENNHGCIAEIHGRWYVFYHRPTHATSTMRKACVEPIEFGADGSIAEVEMTTQGAGGPLDPARRLEAARACLLSGELRVEQAGPAREVLARIAPGDGATFRYFDFEGRGVRTFTACVQGPCAGGRIEVRLDGAAGDLLGVCDIPQLPPDQPYVIRAGAVRPAAGVRAVHLRFDGAADRLFDLDWFCFG